MCNSTFSHFIWKWLNDCVVEISGLSLIHPLALQSPGVSARTPLKDKFRGVYALARFLGSRVVFYKKVQNTKK